MMQLLDCIADEFLNATYGAVGLYRFTIVNLTWQSPVILCWMDMLERDKFGNATNLRLCQPCYALPQVVEQNC